MNIRQKKFCKLYLSGVPACRAYQQAGYQTTGNSSKTASARLLTNVAVQTYLKSMNNKTESRAVKTIAQRKQMLSRIMDKTEESAPMDAIRASAELSKMDGGYEPEKHEVEFIVNIGGDAE